MPTRQLAQINTTLLSLVLLGSLGIVPVTQAVAITWGGDLNPSNSFQATDR